MPVFDDSKPAVWQERIAIDAAGHCLEGVLAYPREGKGHFGVLLTGPHPFLGGDIHNNLVRHLLDGMAAQGQLALTFNYAGVGKSEGGPDDWPSAMSTFWSEGRIEYEREWVRDAVSASAVLARLITAPHVLIGYSFGCWVASRLIADLGARALILISPNPKQHAFDSLNDSSVPILVVYSDNDFTCSREEIVRWTNRLRQPKACTLIHASEHFFRGQESTVLDAVNKFLLDASVMEQEHTRA